MIKLPTLSKFTAGIIKLSVAAVLLAFGANVPPVFGQDDLRDSVYGNKKSAPEKPRTAKKRTKTSNKNNSAVGRNAANNARKTTPKTYLQVTFLSKEPSVEVYLNEKRIGKTNEKLELSKKLAPGEYLLTAKNKNQVLMPARKISVAPGQTIFNLFEEIAVDANQKTEEEIEKEKAKSEMEVALEKSEKVKEVLENYANPATTDSVSTDDWQMVFQAAQLGQMQGYTAVQIEAQRWFASGQIELAKGDFTSAVTAFNKAQEFMPGSALPFYALGNTFFANRKYAEALKFYQKALQIDTKLAMGYKKAGDTQRLLGREKEAIAAYKNAIQFGYATLETRFRLGTLMLETKQVEEAVKELEAIAREMPRPEVYIGIGSGYEKLKRDVSAIEAYQKAIDADPGSALAYFKLADVYQSQREYTKAKESYEKAIALDPEGKVLNKTEAQKKLREATNKLNK